MLSQSSTFFPREFSQGIPREAYAARILAMSKPQNLESMALFANSDPDNNANNGEDDKDARAGGGDGDQGSQAQHSRLAGASLSEGGWSQGCTIGHGFCSLSMRRSGWVQ